MKECRKKYVWYLIILCPITFPITLLLFVTIGNSCGGHSPFIHTKEIFIDCITQDVYVDVR